MGDPLAEAISQAYGVDFQPPAAGGGALPNDPLGAIINHVYSAPLPPSGDLTASTVADQVGKGLTLGWFDEFKGAEGAVRNAIAQVFGGGTNRNFGDEYAARVAASRASDAAVEAAHPYWSTALQITGGAAPIVATGGAAAEGKAASVMADLFGLGGGDLSALRLAKMGATQGALMGAGSADEGSRLSGALKGGITGAVVAPVVGKAVETAVNVAADKLAESGVLSRLASESGAIGKGTPAKPGYTPGEIYLAKQTKNVPVSDVEKAVTDLKAAQDSGAPLFLPEAIDNSKIYRNARFIANNEASMGAAQDAIGSRAADTGNRLTDLFDTISSERNPYTGALNLSKAANDILGQAREARSVATKDIYKTVFNDAAGNPILVNDPAVNKLIAKDANFQAAINEVKRDSRFADLPDNSLAVLHEAKQVIADRADTAARSGAAKEAFRFSQKYNDVNSALFEASPEYEKVTKRYAELSAGVNELQDSKLSFLASLHPDKIDNIGQIFNMPPERVLELRHAFEQAGHGDVFKQGVRAYLQNIVDKSPEDNAGRALSKFVQSPRQKTVLQAALGDSYEPVVNSLATEQRIYKGKGQYFAGSSTAGNLAEESEFGNSAELLKSALEGDRAGLLNRVAGMFKGNVPEDLAQEMGKIYFSTGSGLDALEKVLPLLKQYATNKEIADVSGNAAQVGVSRALGEEKAKTPAAIAAKEQPRSTMQQLFKPSKTEGAKLSTQGQKDIEAKIDADPYYSALYEAESSRNPHAQNPKSSAGGGFQFLDATAKAVGLKDKYDLGQAFDAVQKLTSEHDARFGSDPVSRYSAHYLGATLFEKVREGLPLTAQEQNLVDGLYEAALPQFMRIYNRISKDRGGVSA